ncbi:MAG: TraB domain-containing protein [Nanoarchaeota archaeon]
MKRVIFVPTSHIAEQSLIAVQHAIEKENPDCVAVELDKNRYYTLKSQFKSSNMEALKTLGVITFFIYFFMKSIQSWLGAKVGIFPGTEMISAVDESVKRKIPVVFIDQDVRATFFKIKNIPKKEKLKLLWFLIKVPVIIPLSKFFKSSKKIDLRKVPSKEIISEAMQLFEDEFPVFYKILVTDRNIYMANNVKKLLERFDSIVVVIGAGHYVGMKEILSRN